MVGKNKMKDWKAAVRTWERSEFNKKEQPKKWQPRFDERNYTEAELNALIRDPIADVLKELEEL
jgi:hypothetical protein